MITVDNFNSVAEGANALSSGGRYYGGGTLVMRDANYAEENLERIVRVSDPTLNEIRTQGNRQILGAGVTMAQIIRTRETEHLSDVAKAVGGPAIRSAATLGGNLFAPNPYGDFAVAMLALSGIVSVTGAGEQGIEQFLASRDSFAGIVQNVSLAVPDRGTFRFRKVSRIKPKGVSVMSIAAWLPQSAGRISNARIAFGVMGPHPIRAKAAEQALEGAQLDEATVDRAVATLNNDLRPMDDAIASGWYRSEVAPIHLKRMLLERSG